MTTRLAVIDRITVFITGVLVLLLGLVPAGLYFNIPVVTDTLREIDRSKIGDIPLAGWYIWGLVALAIILVIIGGSMLVTNLRSRHFSKQEVTRPTDSGTTTVHVSKLAQTMGAYLAQYEAIDKVGTNVAMVGDRPTITFILTADPSAELGPLVALVESVEQDFRDAVDDMDMDTVYRLQLSRVEP
ncbi:hypothetical protein [Corynebacterium cystitidis]|uniref:Alkaline shock response membrane anchor protein AmaP n=1 Tax=Corynebacterium cystitidis DSM 20524 TaxID=1121357 RepID=A0A1H9R825_9CORY|nr:hypothetical protein [Corynebacterium cystitidis]WJY81522.1 hypothetical protein CCYS_02765 [Corynebacterium cystitidis DSM 20524]SER68820.1 hypothetical protein SAMN05661109_00805 [Corynebacterium cystitidis DSM 20524]SNV86655.1 Uncharacterised protein [Corynebacterium cystitidis]